MGWPALVSYVIQLVTVLCLIWIVREVKILALIVTEQDVRRLLSYVRQLLAVNVNDRAEIDRLKAEARDAEWTRDASLDAEIEQTLSEIGDATPGAGAGAAVPTTPAADGAGDTGSGSDSGSAAGDSSEAAAGVSSGDASGGQSSEATL